MATQNDYRTRPARGSFAERAGPDLDDEYDDDLYVNDAPSRPIKETRPRQQNTSAHRVREPQAALHVPKPRREIPDLDSSGAEQDDFGKIGRKGTRPMVDTQQVPHERARPRGLREGNQPNRVNRDSLPERSPLQKLQGTFDGMSKEEKRARMQEAEYRSRGQDKPMQDDRDYQRERRRRSDNHQGYPEPPRMNHAEPRRNVTEPNRRRSQRARPEDALDMDPAFDNRRRSGNNATQRHSLAEDGRKRFSQASQALREHSNGDSQENLEDEEPKDELYRRNSKSAHRRRPSDEVRHSGVPQEERVVDDLPRKTSDRRSGSERIQQDMPARSNSKRLQKRDQRGAYANEDRNDNQRTGYPTGQRDENKLTDAHQQLQADRLGLTAGSSEAPDRDADLVPANAVMNTNSAGPTYQVPPHTNAAKSAKARVDPDVSMTHPQAWGSRPKSNGFNLPNRALDEWRTAGVAKLELDDLALDDAIIGKRDSRRDSRNRHSDSLEGPAGETSRGYQPSLFVRCGPLLRYTGLRRERRSRRTDGATVEREIWRGSVMIVTDDQRSSYSAPVLKLFAQPMELLPALPPNMRDDLPNDFVDPIAGQIKPSRTGRPTFVKPVESIPEGVDLSQEEGNEGLFEAHRSSSNKWRIKSKDGERLGKYREVKGARLHTERGLTFWRFNVEVELGITQARVAYRISDGPAIGFWVPARGHTMNIMFHSCNGFSLSVNPDTFSGPDPLWRDVMNSHNMKPYHVMIGGGDQVYNDRVTVQTTLFKEWLSIKNPEHKHHAEFTREMQDELESFYLNRYCMWFSQGMFGMANSQIPMVNLWDDHDIIDGFGSYPHHFMSSKVFTGLGTVAFKYYMLFQHQSVSAETFQDEPSWVLGASPGPYIHQYSRSVFMFLGRRVAFLGMDCRTERRRDEVLCQETYDQVFNRCRAEIVKGETKHLIVLLTVPIAYPRLNFLENILTSRVMDPIKAIGRTGALGGFVNKFDGGVEILDDLDDHWTAKHHKQERNWFIQELQALAAEKSVRITLLGGDVHLGAVGQFFSPKKFGIPKDKDHRYMPNVVSSAIVNTPPPVMMSDMLNRRNKLHHLDDETDEDMIHMFGHDVDGKSRKNKTLLPRRNYCTIREYVPGSTPPHSPDERSPSPPRRPVPDEDRRRYPPGSMARRGSIEEDDRRQYPPGSMGRSRSLTREDFRPRNLIRRLSGSRTRFSFKPDQGRTYQEEEEDRQRSSSAGPMRSGRDRDEGGDYFSHQGGDVGNTGSVQRDSSQGPQRPTNMFRRRPTELGLRSSNRLEGVEGGEDEDPDAINLEGGLDICLNMEVSQQDPAGITVPYRLLVPALFYGGPADANTTRFKTRRASFMDRIRGRGPSGRRRGSVSSDGSQSHSRSPSPSQGMANARPHHPEQHPDDRLQFADQSTNRHSMGKDPRRDSRLAGDAQPTMTAAHDSRPHNPTAPSGQATHATTAPLPQDSYDYHDDDGQSSFQEPRRKLGFLGSIRRRFSSRNRGGGRRDISDGEYSDDYDSGSEGGDGPQNTAMGGRAGARNGGGAGAAQMPSAAGGPRYRAADEHVYRNDGRLPSGASGHGQAGMGNVTRVSAQPRRSGEVDPQQGRSSLDRRTGGPSGRNGHGGGRMDGPEDEEDMTFSDLESLEGQKRNKRSSKAERFFGTGGPGEGMRAQKPRYEEPEEEDEGYDDWDAQEGRAKKGWKFWKRGQEY